MWWLNERFNLRSWQFLSLMASAKCCAPTSEILFILRFNACGFWKLLSVEKTMEYWCMSLFYIKNSCQKLRRILISTYVAIYGTSFLSIPSPTCSFPPFLFSFSVNVAAEALKRDSLYRCSLFLRLKTKFWVARYGHLIWVVIVWKENCDLWLIQVTIGWGFASDYSRGCVSFPN